MKVLLQRVSFAKVVVDSNLIGQIDQGLLLLVGFGQGDDESKLQPIADKILNMRIFADEKSKFNLSLLDIKGEILVISQFTLYADTNKGRRPEFVQALEPAKAKELCDRFIAVLRKSGLKVESGEFGASMQVSSQNEGPVTIMVEK